MTGKGAAPKADSITPEFAAKRSGEGGVLVNCAEIGGIDVPPKADPEKADPAVTPADVKNGQAEVDAANAPQRQEQRPAATAAQRKQEADSALLGEVQAANARKAARRKNSATPNSQDGNSAEIESSPIPPAVDFGAVPEGQETEAARAAHGNGSPAPDSADTPSGQDAIDAALFGGEESAPVATSRKRKAK
jgi:hypothetical protein